MTQNSQQIGEFDPDQLLFQNIVYNSEENEQLLKAAEIQATNGLPDGGLSNHIHQALIDAAEANIKDGTDSGIELPVRLAVHTPEPKLSINQPQQTRTIDRRIKKNFHPNTAPPKVKRYKPKSPCFHPDPNYKRWSTPAKKRSVTNFYRRSTMPLSTTQRSQARIPSSLLSSESPYIPAKPPTWHEAMESRPPLRIDMSGPTPTSYSPRNKPLYETNAPAYSFGRKEAPKEGSGQKAWSKLWFRSQSPFTHKTNFELQWPTPQQYFQRSTLGPKQASRPEFPSHSIGVRRTVNQLNKDSEKRPASNQYQPEVALVHIKPRAPAFTIGSKFRKNSWVKSLNVPAPDVYNLKSCLRAVKPSHPAFTMCVERRYKRHDIGPFATQ